MTGVHQPPVQPTRWSRLAAACAAGMAATVAGARVAEASPERYGALLVGVVVVGSVAAAAEVWRTNRFEARLAAVVLSVLTVLGQVLVATLGGPATSHAHWYPAAFGVLTLGAAVPVLIGLDARSRARSSAPEHPYAL